MLAWDPADRLVRELLNLCDASLTMTIFAAHIFTRLVQRLSVSYLIMILMGIGSLCGQTTSVESEQTVPSEEDLAKKL